MASQGGVRAGGDVHMILLCIQWADVGDGKQHVSLSHYPIPDESPAHHSLLYGIEPHFVVTPWPVPHLLAPWFSTFLMLRPLLL